jgi:hypothetical protein
MQFDQLKRKVRTRAAMVGLLRAAPQQHCKPAQTFERSRKLDGDGSGSIVELGADAEEPDTEKGL